jgi:hypothetical protein
VWEVTCPVVTSDLSAVIRGDDGCAVSPSLMYSSNITRDCPTSVLFSRFVDVSAGNSDEAVNVEFSAMLEFEVEVAVRGRIMF